jgi:signal transduction histidine kinase
MFSRKPTPPKQAAAPKAGPIPDPESASEPRAGSSARREHSLLALLELSNELNASLDVFEVADIALFNLLGHFGSSRGALWLFPEDNRGDAVLVRSHGMPEPMARALGAIWTRWLADRMGAVTEPILVHELGDILNMPGTRLTEESEICLFAPVMARGNFLGLLALGRRVGGEKYSPLDLEILRASLNLLGAAIDNNFLYNRTVESNRILRRLNEKHQELDALKSQFLRNLNHELKTPLTIIIAYLDSLLSQEPADGTRRVHLAQIREQTSKLQGMLLNLLDFSKLLRNEFELRIERTDLIFPLERYFEERRPGVAAGLRELRFSAAANIPPALCDGVRVIQIVDALVDNATKFTPQGAQIHLRVEPATVRDREWVQVQVCDNGPGIPADRLPVICDSFRQGDGSETRSQGGVGIGLSLAKRLIEEMGGSLAVESEIGRGTTFSLLLPI